VSARFLIQLESGRGNISVKRLADLAQALEIPTADLLRDDKDGARPTIALLGLRGAGKSTVGRALADKLGVPFFELDRLIEAEAGMSLAEIFAIHGEGYFREVELAALKKFFTSHKTGVLATGGGIVDSPDALALLAEKAHTVWLKATPEEHWNRVVHQGDLRPMQNRPHAMAELKRRLREREPLYGRAEHVCVTTGKSISQAVTDIARFAERVAKV
jgi:XRE family transcriptional regulator, aerobic/anaerobic benzoate catabolism transcriptional regulator